MLRSGSSIRPMTADPPAHAGASKRRVGALLGCVLGFASQVDAGEVFKCRASDGSIAYRDRACAEHEEALDAPLLARAHRSPPVESVIADPPGQPARPPPVAQVRIEDPLPQMFRCTSPDGSSYVNASPTPRGRYVPLWTLGVGSSGPGLASGTLDPRLGAQYTYVEDTCRAMPRGELCGWWKQRADETGSERRRAFNDRRALLDQEYAGARDALARFCR